MKTEYSEDQYQSNYPDGVQDHWWNLARNEQILRQLKIIGKLECTALEVGCGRGLVVSYLRQNGVNCVGVELADVRPMAGIEMHVRAGTDALNLTAEERVRYDTILLLDVIEHLPEPLSFIENLIRAFPNMQHLVVTVPARQELWSNYDEHYGHFRRYSLAELENISLEIGARVEDKGYFFHTVYPIAWLGAKLGRNRQLNIIPPRGVAKWLHIFLSRVFMLDARLVPRFVPGTSAFASYSFCTGNQK